MPSKDLTREALDDARLIVDFCKDRINQKVAYIEDVLAKEKELIKDNDRDR
jgi:hypothetical protein